MLLLVASVLLGLCASATCSRAVYYPEEQAESYFQLFIHQYEKQYKDEHEALMRFEIFKDNLRAANQMNRNSSSAVFGITRFMDLTNEEFRTMYMGLKQSTEVTGGCKSKKDGDMPNVNAPDSHDWRQHNAVSPIKDQDKCGSCWAFSSIGNIEGQYAIKHGTVQEFSEQQLVDCDTNNSGCGGGFMGTAFASLMAEGGSEYEQDYPYTGQQGKCNFAPSKVKVKIVGCYTYDLKSEDNVKNLVYQTGPISIAIKADSLQFYNGGILSANDCTTGEIDHAVLLIGYGSEGSAGYWIVKNSWGAGWGEKGFFRMERSGANTCSLMNPTMATSVVG